MSNQRARLLEKQIHAVADRFGPVAGECHLILIPSDMPKTLLAQGVPAELAAAAGDHNLACDERARIRLRLAMHAGEIHHDQHGVTGTAINTAFRLLDAEPLRQALRGSPGTLAVIASRWFFEEVIRHIPACAPASWRRVGVSVKETQEDAWICPPDVWRGWPLAPIFTPEVRCNTRRRIWPGV